jgi:hypothetical protein
MGKDVLLTDSTPVNREKEVPLSIARQIIEEVPTIEEELEDEALKMEDLVTLKGNNPVASKENEQSVGGRINTAQFQINLQDACL